MITDWEEKRKKYAHGGKENESNTIAKWTFYMHPEGWIGKLAWQKIRIYLENKWEKFQADKQKSHKISIQKTSP